MLLIPLLLLPNFLFLVPLSAHAPASPPSQGAGNTPLPPGTVTNLAGKVSPSPSCAAAKSSEPLTPATSWSATVTIPTSLFSGRPSGANSTQTYAVSSNGTFSAADGSGNAFALAPLAGLPSGSLSIAMTANSTAALQTFLVTAGGMTVANVAVSYSVVKSSCYPAGLRMEISGTINWRAHAGTVSIPFESQPTFAPVTRTKDNASAAYNPTRALFGRSKGLAVGFDWSDSKKLDPTYDDKTNSIEYQVGDSFLIDPVVTAASSGSSLATKTDYEGFTCYASGRFWVFYNDGVNEGYVSSTDVAAWKPETTITSGGQAGLFAFYCSGGKIYYLSTDGGVGIRFRYGALNPDGTITWAIIEGSFSAAGSVVRGISTAVDPSGAWWVGFGSSMPPLGIEVWDCATPSACLWAKSTSFPYGDQSYVPYADVVPLTSGRVALTVTEGRNTMGLLGLETFSGSSWSGLAYASGSYRLDASTCVSIVDTVECGVDSGDAAVGYISAAYNGNNPSWSGFTKLAACSSSTNCYASMSTDGVSSLAMTFVDSGSTVGYFRSSDSGALWSPEVDFSTGELNPVYVSSPYFLGNHIQAVWTSVVFGVAQSWNVRFAEASTGVPPSATPPWAQPGLSPYGSYVNNAVVYVSMGNGLLSIGQPTFTLPGRGLSVAPTLFYEEPGAFSLNGVPYQSDNFTLANLGLGWSLNFPWLGTYAIHLPNDQQFPYSWNGGTDMQVHGPIDFDLQSTGANGACPCNLFLPSGVQFAFNSARQLIIETDSTGRNGIEFGYGSNGMISLIIDTLGRTVTFAYNSNNQLTAIAAPGGRTWTLAYTGSQLTSLTDPVGRVTSFRYAATPGTGWLVGEVDYPTGGGRVSMSYGQGVVPGGVSYVVNSRNVYSAANTLSQSNFMSYIFSNGTISVDTLGEADGNFFLHGLVTKVFSTSSGTEKTYLRDATLNTFRITENDYASGRLTITKIEDSSGNILAESNIRHDGWGNVIYTKDNIGQQTSLSYANTDSAGKFGISACATTGFYADVIEVNVHDKLVGSCDFQNGAGSPQQEAFYRFDNSGLLLETKVSHDGGWLYTDYTHDAYGNVVSVRDANGNYVYYAYSAAYGGAYLTKESRAVGAQVIATLYAYDLNTGFMSSTTDPDGQTTSYTYDAVGRTLTETFPAVNGISSVASYSYDDAHGVVTSIDSNLNVAKAYFDGLGRETQLQVLNDKGKVYSNTYYTYNWLDKVSQAMLPSGSVYSYAYDSIGRQLSTTNPDGTESTTAYNDFANAVQTTDENGNAKTTTYDWNGRVENVLQRSAYATFVQTSDAYDMSGNLLSSTDAGSRTTTYTYDDLNRLTRATAPDGNSTSYSYDNVGNLMSKVTANGWTVVYAYDSGNRLTRVVYPDGSAISYTYDPTGNVLSVASTLSGTTQEMFTYDARNRFTSATTGVGGGSYTTSYTYDQANNLVSITYPDGLVLPMTYDFENRLVSVGSLASFSYNIDGTIAQITFGDKEEQTYTYDSRNRVTSIVDVFHKVTPLNLTYAYDASSNVVGINSEKFSYDGINRLTSAIGGWGTTAYAYDGAGNMLSSTTGGATVGYVGCGYYSNAVAANTQIRCTTDKDGNIVSKSGGWTYKYDPEDQMVSAALNGITMQTDFYDGRGNRVEMMAGNSTVFTYRGVNLLFERNLASGLTMDHVYGDGMQLAKVVGGNTVYYYHEDALGSTRSTTYVPKKVAVSFSSDYQPYGQSFGANGSEQFRFTDRMVDLSTGLYYMGARFYDPSTMRFMTKDPMSGAVSDPASQSSYAYARDNPLRFTDPTGLSAFSDAWSWLTSHPSTVLLAIVAATLVTVSVAQLGLDPFTDALAGGAIAELVGSAATLGAASLGLPIIQLSAEDTGGVDAQTIAAVIDQALSARMRWASTLPTPTLEGLLGEDYVGKQTGDVNNGINLDYLQKLAIAFRTPAGPVEPDSVDFSLQLPPIVGSIKVGYWSDYGEAMKYIDLVDTGSARPGSFFFLESPKTGAIGAPKSIEWALADRGYDIIKIKGPWWKIQLP